MSDAINDAERVRSETEERLIGLGWKREARESGLVAWLSPTGGEAMFLMEALRVQEGIEEQAAWDILKAGGWRQTGSCWQHPYHFMRPMVFEEAWFKHHETV